VAETWDWGAPAIGAILAGQPPPEPWRAGLGRYDATVVYSTHPERLEALGRVLPSVTPHPPEPPGAGESAATWLARPVARWVASAALRPPSCRPTDDERASGQALRDRLPARFLAVHPGSGSPRKNWPAERYAALAGRLAAGSAFLVVEGPADRAAVQPLLKVPGATAARDLPLRALGALLGDAALYVGNDSGVSHLAAAWGAATVVLFGPTEPGVWAPDAERVLALRGRGGTLEDLEVDEVLEAAVRSAAWPGPR
jgi:hypothetical protein